jgi:hypothetical protein
LKSFTGVPHRIGIWPRSCDIGQCAFAELPQCNRRRTGVTMTNNETGTTNARILMIDHELWRVYELGPAAYDRRGANTLVFESDGVIRRVRNYPKDWRELSVEELFALSWAA